MIKQNKISTVCLFFVASLFFISCKNEKRSTPIVDNQIEFDTITVAERHHLANDTINPYCEIHINFVFPISSEKISVDTLRHFFVESVLGVAYKKLTPLDAVKKYVQSYIENYNTDARIYRENVQDFLAMNLMIPGMYDDEPIDDIFHSYYESLSNTITYNQNGILAFQVKQSNSRGGFISFDSFRNYVLNLHTGEQITEFEIFNPAYDTALQNIIIASLLEQNSVKSVEELENLGFFGIQEIVPNGNFLLDDQGITYTYNKGEYSAYQLDAPEVFIPYSSIRSLLRRGSVVSKLID
ncbi:MAG: RsiV family protein [Dysgonamonadaceae bacterium]|jgi:hypothetical protein|nr:RsiV family protein [Dysgonamonadaceae bacterium]